jgi:hypothetical protein
MAVVSGALEVATVIAISHLDRTTMIVTPNTTIVAAMATTRDGSRDDVVADDW